MYETYLLFVCVLMLYVMQQSEIAALKQDLDKQQEQTEKWVKITLSLLYYTTAAVL